MSQSLHEWLQGPEVQYCRENTLTDKIAFRDPNRVCLQNPNYFFSPCDGTIIYQRIVEPSKPAPIITVNGNPLTVQTITGMATYNSPCLVIGIYVSMLDAKVTRMPYSGSRQYVKLPQRIGFNNCGFRNFEDTLLQGFVDYDDMEFVFRNQKRMNTVVSSKLNYSYYMIQTIEKPIETIHDFHKSKEFINQNDRVDLIKSAYLLDLVMPLNMAYNFSFQQEEGTHVKAGLDRLVQIKPKRSV